MNSTVEIDIGMILIASATSIGLGMIWYSSKLFGNQWIKLNGMTGSKMSKDMGLTYALTYFALLVAAFILEIMLANIPNSNAMTGLIIGFWSGAGLVATTTLSDYLFTGDTKKYQLYLINSGFHIVSLMVMGFLLGL